MKVKAGVVAFAFGAPANIRSNVRLAEIATKKACELDAAIFTQRDVWIVLGTEVEHADEQSGNPPPTLRIARGAVRWAMTMGISELFVAAAEPHLQRCLRDLRYAVQEAGLSIPVWPCKVIYSYLEEEWFCLDSTQKRTQSKEAWEKRERILRCMPMFLYKIVAS